MQLLNGGSEPEVFLLISFNFLNQYYLCLGPKDRSLFERKILGKHPRSCFSTLSFNLSCTSLTNKNNAFHANQQLKVHLILPSNANQGNACKLKFRLCYEANIIPYFVRTGYIICRLISSAALHEQCNRYV